MTSVKTITKFKFQGVEYNDLRELKKHLHNTIGEEVIDVINKNVEIKHRDLFKLLDILCMPEVRKALKVCYNATFETEEGTIINVLDIK